MKNTYQNKMQVAYSIVTAMAIAGYNKVKDFFNATPHLPRPRISGKLRRGNVATQKRQAKKRRNIQKRKSFRKKR
jgi:hypothetical protein